jgi:hypothetical protein
MVMVRMQDQKSKLLHFLFFGAWIFESEAAHIQTVLVLLDTLAKLQNL